MIRRNVLQGERDSFAVKWALLASVFALTIGCFAEATIVTRDAAATAVVEQHEAAPLTAQVTRSS